MKEPRFKLTPVGACSTPGCAEAIFAESQRYAPARCCAGCEVELFEEVMKGGPPDQYRGVVNPLCSEECCRRNNHE